MCFLWGVCEKILFSLLTKQEHTDGTLEKAYPWYWVYLGESLIRKKKKSLKRLPGRGGGKGTIKKGCED